MHLGLKETPRCVLVESACGVVCREHTSPLHQPPHQPIVRYGPLWFGAFRACELLDIKDWSQAMAGCLKV